MGGDLGYTIGKAVLYLVPMILSLTVHEFAHAIAAKSLGDTTAEQQGRLTLNPLPHIDPIGTIAVPLMLHLFSGGSFGFGWAKPVPFNPTRFRRGVHPRTGATIVAAAGPLSNLLLATLCVGTFAVFYHSDSALDPAFKDFLIDMTFMNIALAVFNFIPVHPLDGQKVLAGLLPTESAVRFERFSYQYGMWLIIAVIVFARDIMAVPIIAIFGGLRAVFGV